MSFAWPITCSTSRYRLRSSGIGSGRCRRCASILGAYRHLIADNIEKIPLHPRSPAGRSARNHSALLLTIRTRDIASFWALIRRAPICCAIYARCTWLSTSSLSPRRPSRGWGTAWPRLWISRARTLCRWQPTGYLPTRETRFFSPKASAFTRRCSTGLPRSPHGRGGHIAGRDRGAGAVSLRRTALFADEPPGTSGYPRPFAPSVAPLRDEPATYALLTLAAPRIRSGPPAPAVSTLDALLQGVDELDLVRALLLAQIVYRPKDGLPQLSSWEKINPEMRERISYVLGGRFDTSGCGFPITPARPNSRWIIS